MKQIFLSLAFCTTCAAASITANAQAVAGMNHGKWEEGESHRTKPTSTAAYNKFLSTEMSVSGRTINFSGLPEVQKPIYAVITNANGEFVKQAKIGPDQSSMSISKLRGGLYFVTIMYRNESKIGFTMNL